MYTLILIATLQFHGASVDIDHIPFNTRSDCQEALIEILRDTRENKDGLVVRGYCVAKG